MKSEPHEPSACLRDPDTEGICDGSMAEAHLVGIDEEMSRDLVVRCRVCAQEVIRRVVDRRAYIRLIESGISETIVHLKPLARTLRLPLGQDDHPSETE